MLSYSQTRADFVSQKVHDHDDPDDEEEVSMGGPTRCVSIPTS